jgi:hypothetical protein
MCPQDQILTIAKNLRVTDKFIGGEIDAHAGFGLDTDRIVIHLSAAGIVYNACHRQTPVW